MKQRKHWKNRTMKQYIATIILFTVFGGGTSSAQELLDTKSAIEIALKNNLDIQIANRDLEVSKNNAHLLNSGFLPTLTGTSSANYGSDFSQENILLNGDVVEFNNIKSTNYRAGLDLSVTLFDGLGRKYNYKSLKETYGITELQVRETIENTILNLFSVYYEVARLTENKVTLKETLQL
ncbi:MAG: TolC family protein, partial [Bacteroidota bacterium]